MKHNIFRNNPELDVIKLAKENSGIQIDELFKKLESIKGKELNEFEKRYLCLKLCQYPNRTIAYIYDKGKEPSEEEIWKNSKSLDKRIKILRAEASKGLNQYIKKFLGNEESYLPHSKNGQLKKALLEKDEDLKICKIIKELKNNGYSQTNSNNSHPEMKVSMTITNDQIIPNNQLNEVLNSLKQIAPSFELVVVYKNLTDN